MVESNSIKDLVKELSDIADGISLDGLTKYCNLIILNVAVSCDVDKNDIIFSPIQDGENINISFQIKRPINPVCFKKAFLEIVDKMPPILKDLFLKQLEQIERRFVLY